MDWSIIINWVLSGTTVGGIFLAIRFWRQSKRLKDNEVKQSDVETQTQEMNLADLYKKNMLELLDTMKQNQSENIGNQQAMMEKLEELKGHDQEIDRKIVDMSENMGELGTNISNVIEFLNGEYQAFVSQKKTKKTIKK